MSDNISPNIFMDRTTGYRYEATIAGTKVGLWASLPSGQARLIEPQEFGLVPGDRVRIQSNPDNDTISILLNGEEILSYSENSLQSGSPGIHSWNSDNITSTVAVDNFKAGDSLTQGISVSIINDDNIFKSNQLNTINGNFENLVTSVVLLQEGSPHVDVPFTQQSNNSITCVPIDMHSTGYVDGAGTIIVSDSTNSTSHNIIFSAEPEYVATVVNSVSPIGILKNIPNAAAGDVIHTTPLLAGSTVSINADGALAVFTPAVVNNSSTTWWHWSADTRLWTRIDMTITTDWDLVTSFGPWLASDIGEVKNIKFYF